jgi:HSP20 family protein
MESWAIPLDVIARGDEFIVRATLPGVAPEDIQVSIEDNVLTIKGQTAAQIQNGDGGTYLMRERRTGSFHRALRLPDTVDTDKAHPEYQNGVLTVTIPKAEAKKARQLKVQVGSGVGNSHVIEGGS